MIALPRATRSSAKSMVVCGGCNRKNLIEVTVKVAQVERGDIRKVLPPIDEAQMGRQKNILNDAALISDLKQFAAH